MVFVCRRELSRMPLSLLLAAFWRASDAGQSIPHGLNGAWLAVHVDPCGPHTG